MEIHLRWKNVFKLTTCFKMFQISNGSFPKTFHRKNCTAYLARTLAVLLTLEYVLRTVNFATNVFWSRRQKNRLPSQMFHRNVSGRFRICAWLIWSLRWNRKPRYRRTRTLLNDPNWNANAITNVFRIANSHCNHIWRGLPAVVFKFGFPYLRRREATVTRSWVTLMDQYPEFGILVATSPLIMSGPVHTL